MNTSHRSEPLVGDPSVVSTRHVFRGIEYVVILVIDSGKETFVLEVEDRLTADQWRGQFDARCKLLRSYSMNFCLRGVVPLHTTGSDF